MFPMKRKLTTSTVRESVVELLQRQGRSVRHETNRTSFASCVIDVDNEDEEIPKTLQTDIPRMIAADASSDLNDAELRFSLPSIPSSTVIDILADKSVSDDQLVEGESCIEELEGIKNEMVEASLESVEQSNGTLWDMYATEIHRVAENQADSEISEDSWKLRYQVRIAETPNVHTLLCRAERQHVIAEKKNNLLMNVLRKEIKANVTLAVRLQALESKMKI